MQHTCKRCGYTWESKKEKPKACPNCKSYRFDVPKKPDDSKKTS